MDEQFHPLYYNAIDQIYHAEWTIAKLARQEMVRKAIAALWPHGHPTRLVQVAGTSGKGSTCRFLELGLAVGGKSGAFLSPHLFDYRERFSIDGEPPSQTEVHEAWERVVKPLSLAFYLQNHNYVFSFHEINILMALVLFDKHQVAWAALETGVGGRYDQTTVLNVMATALTNVGRDHEHILGSEQWQRTLDKAGIARAGIPLFTSEQDPFTRHIIAAVCTGVHAPLHVVDTSHLERLDTLLQTITQGQEFAPDALIGSVHQRWNAALSLEVLRFLLPHGSEQQIVERFLAARMTGRFWQVEAGIYADIAHNPDKIAALVREVEQKFGGVGKLFVVGISGKRSPISLLAPLAKVAKALLVTQSSFKSQDVQLVQRDVDALAVDIPLLVIADPRKALEVARAMREADDIIVLTGSTYIIDQALNPDPYLRFLNATAGWRTRRT